MQEGQWTKPFSLHLGHLSLSIPFTTTLQLPPQSKQGTKRAPPHPPHVCLPIPLSTRVALSILPSRPVSFSSTSSSNPPTYLPFTNTRGSATASPTSSFTSRRKSPCSDTSRSSNTTRCVSSTSRTLLQSSNVFLTPRNDVVYTTTVSLPPGGHFSGNALSGSRRSRSNADSFSSFSLSILSRTMNMFSFNLLPRATFTLATAGFAASCFTASDFTASGFTGSGLGFVLASNSSSVWKELVFCGGWGCWVCWGGDVEGGLVMTGLRSWSVLLTSSQDWGASLASSMFSLWSIGAGRGVLSWWTWVVVSLRCFSHGSSMAFMSNTAKLVGAGRYGTAATSTPFDEAHPISLSLFLLSFPHPLWYAKLLIRTLIYSHHQLLHVSLLNLPPSVMIEWGVSYRDYIV